MCWFVSTAEFEFLKNFRQRTLYDFEDFWEVPDRPELATNANAREKYVDYVCLNTAQNVKIEK